MTIKIEIRKNSSGNLSAILGGSPDRAYNTLFQFAYRKDETKGGWWLFWVKGERNPAVFQGPRKQFPMEYFRDACRAKYFLWQGSWGGLGMPDDICITYGGGHIGLRSGRSDKKV